MVQLTEWYTTVLANYCVCWGPLQIRKNTRQILRPLYNCPFGIQALFFFFFFFLGSACGAAQNATHLSQTARANARPGPPTTRSRGFTRTLAVAQVGEIHYGHLGVLDPLSGLLSRTLKPGIRPKILSDLPVTQDRHYSVCSWSNQRSLSIDGAWSRGLRGLGIHTHAVITSRACQGALCYSLSRRSHANGHSHPIQGRLLLTGLL